MSIFQRQLRLLLKGRQVAHGWLFNRYFRRIRIRKQVIAFLNVQCLISNTYSIRIAIQHCNTESPYRNIFFGEWYSSLVTTDLSISFILQSTSTDVSPSTTPCGTPLSGSNAPKFGTVIPNRIFVGGIAANVCIQILFRMFFSQP